MISSRSRTGFFSVLASSTSKDAFDAFFIENVSGKSPIRIGIRSGREIFKDKSIRPI